MAPRTHWSELGQVGTPMWKGGSEIDVLAEHIAALDKIGLRMCGMRSAPTPRTGRKAAEKRSKEFHAEHPS